MFYMSAAVSHNNSECSQRRQIQMNRLVYT